MRCACPSPLTRGRISAARIASRSVVLQAHSVLAGPVGLDAGECSSVDGGGVVDAAGAVVAEPQLPAHGLLDVVGAVGEVVGAAGGMSVAALDGLVVGHGVFSVRSSPVTWGDGLAGHLGGEGAGQTRLSCGGYSVGGVAAMLAKSWRIFAGGIADWTAVSSSRTSLVSGSPAAAAVRCAASRAMLVRTASSPA